MGNIQTTKMELVGEYSVSVEYLEGDKAMLRICREDGGPIEFLHTSTEGVVTPLQAGGYRGMFTLTVGSFHYLQQQTRKARALQLHREREDEQP